MKLPYDIKASQKIFLILFRSEVRTRKFFLSPLSTNFSDFPLIANPS